MFISTTKDRRADAKARIYQAAVRVFAERGGDEISVSELADAAGIARGTIYNNIDATADLFGEVVRSLSREMLQRTEETMRHMEDPVERLATGLRLFVRRAHEEQDWGRFLVRFVLTHSTLQGMMHGAPARDIRRAIEAGRFSTDIAMAPSLASMMTGATLAAMNAVIVGDQAWRTAGGEAAELFLRAGGLSAEEARRLAGRDLPLLAAVPGGVTRPSTENRA